MEEHILLFSLKSEFFNIKYLSDVQRKIDIDVIIHTSKK